MLAHSTGSHPRLHAGVVAGRSSAVVRGHPRRQDQPASALCSLGVQHPADPLHQVADPGHPLGGRAILEERGKPLEVELDAVAVIALDGFLDQPEDVLPDRVVPEIQGSLAQPVLRMLAPEGGTEEVVAVGVVDAEGEQSLQAAVSCLGKKDRVRIGAGVKERLHVAEPLTARSAGQFRRSAAEQSMPRRVPILVG